MTPKEKAKELIDKFAEANGNSFFAKECALIAIDEILDSFSEFDFSLKYIMNRDYWLEVKQEIQIL